MSGPERREVRVRRSPRLGVFLLAGAVVGVLVAAVAAVVLPAGGTYTTGQVLGFLAVIFAAIGALLGGLVAVAVDALSSRRARVLQAERFRDDGPEDRDPDA
jgi:membrane associated rhomboid family serine protease